jgi:hypothetical protein
MELFSNGVGGVCCAGHHYAEGESKFKDNATDLDLGSN